MPDPTTTYDLWLSEPDPETGRRYLARQYHDEAGETLTVCTRVEGLTNWGPEVTLRPERVSASTRPASEGVEVPL